MWIFKQWIDKAKRVLSTADEWTVKPVLDDVFLSDDDKEAIILLTTLLIQMHQLDDGFFTEIMTKRVHNSVYCKNWYDKNFTIYLHETNEVAMRIKRTHGKTINVYAFRAGDWVGDLLDIMQGIKISKFQKLKEA